MNNQAAKTVSDALLGLDFMNVVMEAIKELPEIAGDMLKGISCFICGSEELAENLENGTFEEVRNALEVCFSMMDISAFQCVSSMRNVSMLAARPKQ